MRIAASPDKRRSGGFTLVELVLVIVMLGIISFVASGRISDRDQANARGFADQVASTLRFAQKAAIAQRRNVYVNIDTTNRRVRACLDTVNDGISVATAAGVTTISISGATTAAQCQVTFTQATSAVAGATAAMSNTGC